MESFGIIFAAALAAISAESGRGNLETPVAAANVVGAEAGNFLKTSLVAADSRPTNPYGYTFGVSDAAGERSAVCEFASPVAFACLYTSNPGVSFSWRESASGEWRKMRRMNDEGRAEEAAATRGYSFWYVPSGTKAQAVRVESTIPEDRVKDQDGKYSAKVGAM